MVALDLRRLRFLREFEERGTFAAVATALGYSPSAVSQQLALLEKDVATPLFEKAGRGVRLTDAGRLLARHARVLLAAAEAAEADLAALGGDVWGTVRAGGLQSAARRLLIPAVASMMKRRPVAIADLRSEIWTASAAGTGHHAMVIGTCRSLGGYEPDLRHRSNDADVQLELVRAAAAVALMPSLTLPAADPALAIRDVAEARLMRRLVAVTRDTPPAPALTALLTAVKRHEHEIRARVQAGPASG